MASTEMTDPALESAPVREVVELGLRSHPTCARCGAPMVAAVEDDELWLVCATVASARGDLSLRQRRDAHDLETVVDAVLAA